MTKPDQQGGCLKYLYQLGLLTVVDFVVIWCWVQQIDPDPSVSIGLFVVVPAAFIINLVIAIVLAFVKKQYAALFMINAFIAALLMVVLFINGINQHQARRFESWKFNQHDTAYSITLSKLDSTFSITYNTNPNSSIGLMRGQYVTKQDKCFLVVDSLKLTIDHGMLFGWSNSGGGIKLAKD